MRELHDRLIKFGFDDQTVKSLPRWDQVALVRRFQCGTGRFDEEGALTRAGRIPNDAYIRRLNEIFLNQRKALEPEEPAMTPSESDGGGGPEDTLTTRSKRETTTTSGVSSERAGEKEEGPSLEEELFSGLEIGEGPDEEEERLAEAARAGDTDALEQRALEQFRLSMGKAVMGGDLPLPECKISKSFTPQELRLLQAKPIPRLRWSRKMRDPRTGTVKAEKVVYIYGEENIKLFHAWRARRVSQKRWAEGAGYLGQQLVGTASRTCRRCGQVGHISSNPICPQYTGPRKARPLPAATPARQLIPSPAFGSSEEESEGEAESAAASAVNGEGRGRAAGSRVGKGKRAASSVAGAAERQTKAAKQAKGREVRHDEAITPPVLKLPSRTTARQRQILESKGTLAGAVRTYQGTFDSALSEINQIFQRVISKTDKEKRKWALFRTRVTDAGAPGYSSVVTNPMWLDRMVEKCKAREVRSCVCLGAMACYFSIIVRRPF